MKLSYIWLLGVGYAVQDGTFSVVHLVIAFEYLKIARNVPKAIKRQRFMNRKRRRVVFLLLLVCNVLFPLLEAVVLIPFNTQLFIEGLVPGKIVSYCADIVPDLVGVFQIVSGVILNVGVYRIHSYFKDRKGEVRVNTEIMILHASAFLLYLVGDVVLYLAYTAYVIYP